MCLACFLHLHEALCVLLGANLSSCKEDLAARCQPSWCVAVVLGSLTGPNWVVIMAWMFAAVQLFGTTMVYCQPIFESVDAAYGNIYVCFSFGALHYTEISVISEQR